MPQPIQITQHSLITNLQQLHSLIFNSKDKTVRERVLLPISMHNLFGTIVTYYSLICGSTIYFMPKYSSKQLLSIISEHQVCVALFYRI